MAWVLTLVLLGASPFVSFSQAQLANSSSSKYQSDYNTIKALGHDLYESLKPSFRTQLNPNPIWYNEDIRPYIRPFVFENEKNSLHIVYVSKGFIQLVNRIAH